MSEGAPSEAQSSSGSGEIAPAAPQGRSIFSYFGNGSSGAGAGPSRPPHTAPAKKRRKKDDEPGTQSRLRANVESGWTLGKHGEALMPGPEAGGDEATAETPAQEVEKPKKKRAGRAKDDGEEAEMKEMKKRTREATAKERKGKRKSAEQPLEVLDQEGNIIESEGQVTASSLATGSGTQSSTNSSPVKRARGRPRKSKAALPPSQSQSQGTPPLIDLSQHLSSDPPVDDPPPLLVHRASSPSDIVVTGHLKSEKPGHPFFSRTNSAVSASSRGASQRDPIDIDEPPAPPAATTGKQPKKTVFASDSKPAHSFFSRLTNGDANSTRASSVLSDGAPTEVSTATNKSATEKGKGKGKVHGFFKPNGSGAALGGLKEGWGHGLKEGEGWLNPWPGKIWPSHEPLTPPMLEESGLKRRKLGHCTADPDNFWRIENTESFRSDIADYTPLPAPPLPIHTSPEIEKHPAITSLSHRPPSDAREMWTEHYRPRRACEVLGNEIESTYLRDWLSALAVGSKDGTLPKVVRKIKKIAYKPQSFDGWMVDDIGLFGAPVEEDDAEEDFIEIEEAPLPFHPRPTAYPDFKGRLANAILLIGPQGAGKSAAVHAVTSELDWDVFEVYPGIGKRTAANLFSLVGDVGRNHMVVQTKEDVAAKANGKNFFGFHGTRTSPRKPKAKAQLGLGSQEQPIEVEEHKEEEVVGEDSKFRQSVILFDEVDLLFDEENTFWGAVRSLIAESKRPVILTCNDPETVPLATLPLQAILDFRPPSRSLAGAYLSAMAKQEKLANVDIPTLVAKCTATAIDLVGKPLPPNGHEPMPTFDLRKAISQLQLERDSAPPSAQIPGESQGDLNTLSRQLEGRSFIDAMIAPRAWAQFDEHEIDRPSLGIDDQLDVHLLCKPDLADWRPVIPAYCQSKSMSQYLEHLSGDGSLPAQDLATAQTNYIRSILPALDPLIPLSDYLLPHPSLFLDHLPAIRSMVRADDMMEEAEEAALAEGGDRINRKTGRPVRATAGREGYQRYLYQLNKAACSAALASELLST